MKNPKLALLVGTLDLLILRILGKGSEIHGFGILEWIERSTDSGLMVEEGALYHSLHRMERRGLVQSRWDISEKGRKAKFYRITGKGMNTLEEKEKGWQRYVETVEKISPQEVPEET